MGLFGVYMIHTIHAVHAQGLDKKLNTWLHHNNLLWWEQES